MDVFMEYLIQKKKSTKDKLLVAGLIALGIILTVVLLACMMALGLSGNQFGQMAGSLGALLIAAVWYGVYLLRGMLNVEYEYIVTNNELDIDKILSKRGRKRLVTVDMYEVKLMARVDDETCNDVYKNPPENVKVLNYSALNENLSTYFIDCTVDEKRAVVVFQPTEKMIESLWKYNPRAIKKYNA